ncbi:SRPBCC family protein [Arachnia propionica]|uniref:SRPBCC family protein n=1 Tax=Arachnia propionica TaxID=1750 RepID=A0A3P1TD29_9ACTN|nr:SRPBCC family protein [Arachnia propionica]MDO5081779.1 SRPBCC family protein [Arachnia propionica]RRD07357.1 SRPBCC family protein [Arachnia propionica]
MTTSYHSTILPHPAEQVWAVLRDFNGLATWFSEQVAESHIEDGLTGTTVGAVRSFRFGDSRIREHLLALDDLERSYAYEFCDPAPFPVTGYVARLRVTPVTDGDAALVEWWVDFDCETSEQEHWRAFFAAEVFAPALEGLRCHLAA